MYVCACACSQAQQATIHLCKINLLTMRSCIRALSRREINLLHTQMQCFSSFNSIIVTYSCFTSLKQKKTSVLTVAVYSAEVELLLQHALQGYLLSHPSFYVPFTNFNFHVWENIDKNYIQNASDYDTIPAIIFNLYYLTVHLFTVTIFIKTNPFSRVITHD